MARFCAGLSATCAADAPGASSAPIVWAVTSGTMAKHASKAAMTGVEKTVRPLMLLRAGVSEPPKNTIPRRPAWFLVKMISKRRRYDRFDSFGCRSYLNAMSLRERTRSDKWSNGGGRKKAAAHYRREPKRASRSHSRQKKAS